MINVFYMWLAVALALMAAETFVPGAFLLWFGFAAAAMGLITWLWPTMPVLAQALTFGVLSFISIWVYRRYFHKRDAISDQPLLNRRADQMMGRIYELHEPIHNGFGKIRVNDALWTVRGADLPAGTRVVVTGIQGLNLDVRPAD